MKAEKKVISDLTLCYWVTTLDIKGELYFLVASEKAYSCLLFDRHGKQVDEVWKEPGGTMTAVQVPGADDGAFLATHRMYSPDDNREASIVFAYPAEDGWKIRKLCRLQGVHRFDILRRNGINYLIACTIKSDYEYDDDWRFPGKVFAARLPEDLKSLPDDYELPLTILTDALLKNHGYSRDVHDGVETAVITSEEGVFRYTPPAAADESWTVEQYLAEPTSDALFLDLDGDGSSADIVSRSVARDKSYQKLDLRINGNAACSGHTECDSIIMDEGRILAVPQLEANCTDSALIHEAAIGKIAGDQLIKLMTLGLTEQEAEEQIVNGFLK